MTYDVARTIGANTYSASFTIDIPTNTVTDSTLGLTVNSINFPVDNGIQYTYSASSDFLAIDGALPNLSTTGNDFSIAIINATSSNPALLGFGLRLPGQGVSTGITANGVTFNAYAGAPAPVPLPAGLPLLLSALAGIFLMRKLKPVRFKLAQSSIPTAFRDVSVS